MKKNIVLNAEELQIEKDIEAGLYQPVKDFEKEYQFIKKAMDNTFKKKAISIRLSDTDIDKIKSKALSEGIPYQTLINSIVHKYAAHAV